MLAPEINIFIDQKLKVSFKRSWLKNIALEILEAVGIMGSAEIGLVITDNDTVQQLNRTYRGLDEPTDVLAFHMLSGVEQDSDISFISPPDGVNHLGEVVLAYPQAILQAQEQSHSVEQELALLIIHGILHLVGYNHEGPEEEQRMRTKEKEIMKTLEATWVES